MTVKSSGSISFKNDIIPEFGESKGTTKLSNYIREHKYGDMKLPLDPDLPMGGSVKFSDFRGTRLHVIADAYSNSFCSANSYVLQKRADTLTRTNIGSSKLKVSKTRINNCTRIIVHVNRTIGSKKVSPDPQGIARKHVAFLTGTDWPSNTKLKIYVGGGGLIAGAGGDGGNGGQAAAGANSYAEGGHDNRKMSARYQDLGHGNCGLGIDYTPANVQVTVIACNHPYKLGSGLGAIVGGCSGGGGGAGADRWHWLLVPIQVWEGAWVEETVPNPDYPAPEGEPAVPEYITRIKEPKEPLYVEKKEITLQRYWSGGGGGGGGAGLPAGKGGIAGYHTGTIPPNAGTWDGTKPSIRAPVNLRADPGGDGGDNLNISNLTSGMGGAGGYMGLGGSGLAQGGMGGDGGYYQSSGGIASMYGEDGEDDRVSGEIHTYQTVYNSSSPPNPNNPHPTIYGPQPASRFDEDGGDGGWPGYAIICNTAWSDYGPNHESNRVMGGFFEWEPKQG